MKIVLYLHLLGATVWIGGLITMAALVRAVRRTTGDRNLIRIMARRFGVLSWSSLGLLVVTGLSLASDRVWNGVLVTKVILVAASAALAFWHTRSSRTMLPATRGAIQGLILILALVILGLAVAL